MNHASLFSGIGGFDLAAREVGWNNVFQCEIDPFCQSVLKYYFPKTVLYEDIKRTDFTSWKGKIDVLTGGFPCQPFSVAGQRKGADDDRYLWPEMLRVIRETRPLWVIGENVAGITNMVQPGSETDVETKSDQDEENYKETILEQEYIINTICDDLEREGYSVQPIIVPACGVGAPHKRYRIWFIASWDMKIKLDVFEAIKNYAPDDILIISNQGGIEKGFVDKEMFEYKFDYISNALEDYTDVSVSAYYCESNNKRNINRKPNIGMIKEYMDFIEDMNNDEDEEEKIVYDTILMIGDASGKEGQFSDSDKKTAENFGCEYMDVDDFVDKYKD